MAAEEKAWGKNNDTHRERERDQDKAGQQVPHDTIQRNKRTTDCTNKPPELAWKPATSTHKKTRWSVTPTPSDPPTTRHKKWRWLLLPSRFKPPAPRKIENNVRGHQLNDRLTGVKQPDTKGRTCHGVLSVAQRAFWRFSRKGGLRRNSWPSALASSTRRLTSCGMGGKVRR